MNAFGRCGHAVGTHFDLDAFAVLGLDPGGRAVTASDVNREFRRLCLTLHPDKRNLANTTASEASEASEASNASEVSKTSRQGPLISFDDLVRARERALGSPMLAVEAPVEGQTVRIVRDRPAWWERAAAASSATSATSATSGTAGNPQAPPQDSWTTSLEPDAVDWGVTVASIVLLHVRSSLAAAAARGDGRLVAETLTVDLPVSLEDIYHARVKKIVVSVVRRPLFTRTRQALYVRLMRSDRSEPLRHEHLFPGMGDDSLAEMLLPALFGRERKAPGFTKGARGDVLVRLVVAPHPVFSPDPVLYPCDLHATVPLSLHGYCHGQTTTLPHFSGTPVVASYTPPPLAEAEEDADTETDPAPARHVQMFPGLGLPYRPPDDSSSGSSSNSNREVHRGDLYVFMELRLPSPRALRETFGDLLEKFKIDPVNERPIP